MQNHFLKRIASHSKPFTSISLFVGFCILLLCFAAPVLAQNTKGDRPAGNRETRFKTPSKKDKKKRGSSNRIRSGNRSAASKARGGERVGKPIKPVYSVKPPRNKQRAWKGDISGRRLRTKNYSTKQREVYPQVGEYVRRRVRDKEGVRNVYPKGRYTRNPSSRPRDTQRAASNRVQVRQQRGPELADRRSSSGKRHKKIVPRSASRSYIARKSINIYARFARPKKKGERAVTKDIAGRRLRAKNYETPRQGVIPAIIHPSQKRNRIGDRPYAGTNYGGYFSISRSGRAWKGDITNRKIRNRSSKRSVEGVPTLFGGYRTKHPRKRPYTSGGYATRTRPGETRPGLAPLPVKPPGMGGQMAGYRGRLKQGQLQKRNQGEGFTGFLKARRPLRGGGSVSGRRWNNNGIPIPVRTPANGAQIGGYQGKLKRGQRALSNQGEEYTGNIKFRRPLKGGGSVSGRLWNNNGTPLAPRIPGGANINTIPERLRRSNERRLTDQGEGYTGNIKFRRPLKGGGSVSGKLWNNNEKPVHGRTPNDVDRRVAGFMGNMKARRPEKGGGSVSGKLWNNNETPIEGKTPSEDAMKMASHSGNIKVNQMRPRFQDQGEEFTGYIKLKRKYVQNQHAAHESIKKRKPDASINEMEGLQVKVKQFRYKHNPSSAKEALKVREPGKAFARATDYQGNIKMQKYTLFEKNRSLHPDSKFVKLNRNNVASERDALTNLKLWWARLFKKQEAQPEHLKEKERKPRYDNGEQGMWYD